MNLTVGRIGSLPSSPVQIRCTDIGNLICYPLNDSEIGRWIRTELSGFNLVEVVCIDDEQTTDSFLQFRIPTSEEDDFPKNCCFKGKSCAIDHAFPFATPVSTRARPPHEQTVHEHWKKTARLAPRVIKKRESSYQTNTNCLSVFTEQPKMPWCFFTGCVNDDDALDCFYKYGIVYLENKNEVELALENQDKDSVLLGETYCETTAIHIIRVCCNDEQPLQIGLFHEGKYGWTVSTSELVQCHAYTPCTMAIMTPPGCRLSDLCIPSRHYTIRKVIAVHGKKQLSQVNGRSADSFPTPIGVNQTAVSPTAGSCYFQDSNKPPERNSAIVSSYGAMV